MKNKYLELLQERITGDGRKFVGVARSHGVDTEKYREMLSNQYKCCLNILENFDLHLFKLVALYSSLSETNQKKIFSLVKRLYCIEEEISELSQDDLHFIYTFYHNLPLRIKRKNKNDK